MEKYVNVKKNTSQKRKCVKCLRLIRNRGSSEAQRKSPFKIYKFKFDQK